MSLPVANALVRIAEYNVLRTQVSNILGPGTGTSGYGQILNSIQIPAGRLVSAADWERLKFDILSILLHQEGVTPNLITMLEGRVISAATSEAPAVYTAAAVNIGTNKFNLAAGQFVTESRGTISRTWDSTTSPATSWRVSISTTTTVSFNTADEARFFFNSGSKIRFSSSRTGGTDSAQNSSWTSLLNTAGTQSFGANVPEAVNFYTLTNVDQFWYTVSASSPYTTNRFRIAARCNITNNTNGGATSITFTATWEDRYNDPGPPAPGDLVNGTIDLFVSQTRASGGLYPNLTPGSFSIASPTYSLGTITGS
jgi:hypothetical protein